ncbi:MAG: hypothetical protein DMG76_15935 [Acidobacteria bacterium]|nr:MAG: hypothetical protein DMG76_15935 [Acidobacteriota bacterium]
MRVKGAGPTSGRKDRPRTGSPRPGSRGSGGGDDAAEGFDGEGRDGDVASVHAVTYVNAEQPETGNAGVQRDFTKSVLFCTVVLVGKSVKANT